MTETKVLRTDWDANMHAEAEATTVGLLGTVCGFMIFLLSLLMMKRSVYHFWNTTKSLNEAALDHAGKEGATWNPSWRQRFWQTSGTYRILYSVVVLTCLIWTTEQYAVSMTTLESYRNGPQKEAEYNYTVLPSCAQLGGGAIDTRAYLWCPYGYTDSCPRGCQYFIGLTFLHIFFMALFFTVVYGMYFHLRSGPYFWKRRLVSGLFTCPITALLATRLCPTCKTRVSYASLHGVVKKPLLQDIYDLEPSFHKDSTWVSIARIHLNRDVPLPAPSSSEQMTLDRSTDTAANGITSRLSSADCESLQTILETRFVLFEPQFWISSSRDVRKGGARLPLFPRDKDVPPESPISSASESGSSSDDIDNEADDSDASDRRERKQHADHRAAMESEEENQQHDFVSFKDRIRASCAGCRALHASEKGLFRYQPWLMLAVGIVILVIGRHFITVAYIGCVVLLPIYTVEFHHQMTRIRRLEMLHSMCKTVEQRLRKKRMLQSQMGRVVNLQNLKIDSLS
eukprot:ANDGO_01670.mRNA.1 hypothetical protein